MTLRFIPGKETASNTPSDPLYLLGFPLKQLNQRVKWKAKMRLEQTEGLSNRLSTQGSSRLLKCRILIAKAAKLQQSTCGVLTGPVVCLDATFSTMIELNICSSLFPFLLLLLLLLVHLTLFPPPFAHE